MCCVTDAERFFLIPLFNVCLHSIGYPVVTLGFGFKSYVSYKMRLRKQKEVQKENEFYMQLLQQALPPEQQMLQRQEREAEEGTFRSQRCVQHNNKHPSQNILKAFLNMTGN